MSLHNVSPGAKAPDEFNVIIEIPMMGDPIKYEVDEETGALFVDRFMGTSMHYPCNYGYIPQTLADDGDPVDVLVMTPVPLIPGVVVTCRALGLLEMDDEALGDDAQWMQPGMQIVAEYYEGRPVSVKLPSSLVLEVVDTSPVMKTATKTASSKPAKLENGVTVNVPEFVGVGDRVKVNPATGEYLERAK